MPPIEIKNRNSDKENTWLLIKHNDKFATDEIYDSEKETPKNSPINKALVEKTKEPVKKKSGTASEQTHKK